MKALLRLVANAMALAKAAWCSRTPRPCGVRVFLDLHDAALAKDLAVVILALARQNCELRVRLNPRLLAGFTGLGRQLLLASRPLPWSPWQRPRAQERVWCDEPQRARQHGWQLLYPEARLPAGHPVHRLQVGMHPSLLVEEQALLALHTTRVTTRLARVFFSGNTDPQAYANTAMACHYGVPTRLQIIEALLSPSWPGPSPVVLRTASDLQRFLQGAFADDLVVAQWRWSPQSSSGLECRIPNDRWLEVLASVEYFLACPGIRTLDCHNLAEALAMGATPMLPASSHWHGIFENGRNALLFEGLNDLPDAMTRAFDGHAPQRNVAMTTYQEHFSLQAIAQSFTDPKLSSEVVISPYQEVYVPY